MIRFVDSDVTYDHRGLVTTEVNAKGDGKVFVYDGNGNLISKTDEDGYVTEYDYSPVNLVSEIRYADGKVANYLYDGTGDLIKMDDWNGTTSISMDLLDRITSVTDHKSRTVEYGWDAVGNKTSQGYPDGSQVDYWYDAENQIVQVQDFDGGVTLFEYDPDGNKIYKEYPNNETAWYSYDVCDQIIEMDEYDLGGKKLYKTTYSWDAEGNRLSEMQYNHGQSVDAAAGPDALAEDPNTSVPDTQEQESGSVLDSILNFFGLSATDPAAPSVDLSDPNLETTSAEYPIVNAVALPDPTANTAAGIFLNAATETASETNAALMQLAEEETAAAETPEPEAPATEVPVDDTEEASNKPETGKGDASVEGNGDGNGQVPPGQTEDGDGNIVNNGGNMAPGLNRGDKIDKPENPNKPDKPENPGTEDKDDKKANKANSGTHIYTYDELNRMVSSDIAKVVTNYSYDTLGNLVLETSKNKSVDYEYNELNQLVRKTTSTNEVFTYTYDARGNRTTETGKKASQSFVYDATNRLVEGTNWKGDKSAYTYNGLGLRVNNLVTTHAGKTYDRDYVIDYTSPENDDLYVYAMGNGQLEYEQRHVYAGSERLEQITEKGNGGWERTLYVHEDVMGNTRYYTKATGQTFAELQYDAWGQPVSPNKLVNNDHGNYVFATFTGHIYDPVLDIYFAEARFYDSTNRTWMAMDPIKDGLNWYQYTYSNPIIYFDPNGNMPVDLLNHISDAYNQGKLNSKQVTVLVEAFNLGNLYTGLHEIAQVHTANQLYNMGYDTELEYRVRTGEVDVVASGVYAWEIKPSGTSGKKQLQKYINNSDLMIRDVPLGNMVNIPIIGDIKMGIEYTSELGVGHYYFYSNNSKQKEYESENVKSKVALSYIVPIAIGGGIVIFATIAEDVITGGFGLVDDIPTISAVLGTLSSMFEVFKSCPA